MADAERPHPRQLIRYAFYKARPEWLLLPDEDKHAARKELAELILEWKEKLPMLRTYSTVGTRADTDLLLWLAAPTLEEVEAFEALLRKTAMGRHLDRAYSYLAMTRRSQYEDRLDPSRRQKLQVRPGRAKYLFVYPFVKTRAWYRLPFAERQEMMDVHIEVGHKYPTVKLNTTYSFGLDDQEFVVAFESDHPDHFLDLVMELRESRASEFTLRDTPIFTCLAGDPETVLGVI